MVVDGIDGRRKFAGTAADQVQELQLGRTEKAARFGVGLSRENTGADDDVRLGERGRRLEIAPVKMERDLEIIGREMRGEGEGKPELGGKSRAEIARAEQIQRHVQSRAGNGLDRLSAGKVRLQLDEILRKSIAA